MNSGNHSLYSIEKKMGATVYRAPTWIKRIVKTD
jgi:hypothetical protein